MSRKSLCAVPTLPKRTCESGWTTDVPRPDSRLKKLAFSSALQYSAGRGSWQDRCKAHSFSGCVQETGHSTLFEEAKAVIGFEACPDGESGW